MQNLDGVSHAHDDLLAVVGVPKSQLEPLFQLTFWDVDNSEEITMTVADAIEILHGNEKV